MSEDHDSDRFRDLSEGEQRIVTMRRDGYDVVDRQGRPRLPLGDGPESRLVIASTPIRRRRKPHVSDIITEAEFRRMYEAVAIANVQRMILNTFVTISWKVGGITYPGHVDALHTGFLERMRAWASYESDRRPKLASGAIWVKEVGKTLGLHSHFLVHVPDGYHHSFRDWAQQAAHRLVEMPRPDRRLAQPKERLILTLPLGDSTAEQWKVFRYLMKGVEPDAVLNLSSTPHLKLLLAEFDRRVVPQGLIEGARVGRTQSLGPGALAEAEKVWGRVQIWPDAYDPDDLPMNDRFLRHGELHAQLKQIVE